MIDSTVYGLHHVLAQSLVRFAGAGYKQGLVDEAADHVTFEFTTPYVIAATPPSAPAVFSAKRAARAAKLSRSRWLIASPA